VAYPEYFLDDGDALTIDGEEFEIQHLKHTHTNTDITISHINSNTIFLGDVALESTLAYFGVNGGMLNNIKLLKKIKKQPKYTLYVPGHGTSGTLEEVVLPYLFYLEVIKEEVEKAYDKDMTIFGLDECRKKIIEQLEWEDDIYFTRSFIKYHTVYMYDEMETLSLEM